MKILFCSSEVVPFAKTGGLADVAGALPISLEEQGQEIRVIMPLYRMVKNLGAKLEKLNQDVYSAKIGKDVTVYFLENKKFFDRDNLYVTKEGDYPDNLERFSFFCEKSLEFIKKIKFKPDVIHCNDWQTSLIPVFLKTKYKDDPFYSKIKTILTVHNLGYQGLFPKEKFSVLGLGDELFSINGLEFYGKVNVLKGGLLFSDYITAVSPTYAKEIQTKEFGAGLEGLLEKRKDMIFGIINGIDYSIWDPKKDELIFKKYDSESIASKYVNKTKFQQECGLKEDDKSMLLGMVSRLAEQKGVDILAQALPDILKLDMQVVILGTGDVKYHQILEAIARKFPKKFSLHLKFDETLAHKIYAASDFFLMPSRYEPCGLGQLISFKYGTLPVVSKTGGLVDTVKNFDIKTKKGDGFVLSDFTKKGFIDSMNKARAVFADKALLADLIKAVMLKDFSWNESAKKYIQLYKKVLSN